MRIAVLDRIRSSFGLRDGSIFAVFDRNGGGVSMNRRRAVLARRPRRVIVNQFTKRAGFGVRKIVRTAEMTPGVRRTFDVAESFSIQNELRKDDVPESNRAEHRQ